MGCAFEKIFALDESEEEEVLADTLVIVSLLQTVTYLQ